MTASKSKGEVVTSQNVEIVDMETGELVRGGDVQTAKDLVAAQVASLTDGAVGAISSTMSGGTLAERKALYTALNDAEPIMDHLGEEFTLADIVAQAIEVVDAETKELVPATRTILVTKEGKAYAAVSDMLFRSVKTITGILGQPSEWPEDVKVKVVEKRSKQGRRFYSISLV